MTFLEESKVRLGNSNQLLPFSHIDYRLLIGMIPYILPARTSMFAGLTAESSSSVERTANRSRADFDQ